MVFRREQQGSSFLRLVQANRRDGDQLVSMVQPGQQIRFMENGKIVLDGTAAELRSDKDIREFYLGAAGERRKSYREVKQYRRSRRWYG